MMSLFCSFFLEEQPVLVSQKRRNVSLEGGGALLVPLCVYSGPPVQVEHMLLFPALMMKSVSMFIPL